jgi:hypothetical protein
MALASATQTILRLVEEKTDRPVELLADASIKVLAKVKMAKGAAPAHLITYNPTKRGVDYIVAYECGFILRLYENPPEARFEFGGSESGRKAVRRALFEKKQIKRMGLPETTVKQLADQMFDGLMTQLRSMPIGIRIDKWLWDEHPDLRELQTESIMLQQQDNVQALGSQIREMSPSDVFLANVAMNSAFAIFFDRLIQKDLYAVPYRSVGFENSGERLLEIEAEIPSDAIHDRNLVDAWAEELEVSDWYRWIPVS